MEAWTGNSFRAANAPGEGADSIHFWNRDIYEVHGDKSAETKRDEGKDKVAPSKRQERKSRRLSEVRSDKLSRLESFSDGAGCLLLPSFQAR